MNSTRFLLPLVCSLLSSFSAPAQSVTSKADLIHYLSRAVTDSRLRDYSSNDRPAAYDFLQYTDAKFIGRAVGPWGNERHYSYNWWWNSVVTMCSTVKALYLQNGQDPPILQAGIFEILTPEINQVQIPSYVLDEYLPATAPNAPRNFNRADMTYDQGWQHGHFGPNGDVPDLSKIETQMYFYYLATKYIDAGINAIHFGRIRLMDDNDPGYFACWDLLTRIRNYAASQGTFVLCDAHTHGAYYSPVARAAADFLKSWTKLPTYLDLTQQGYDVNDVLTYNDNTNLQLLFDFHSSPIRPDEVGNGPINGNYQCVINPNFTIFNRSKGGISPFLGYYNEMPYLVELDNFGGVTGTPGVKDPAAHRVWGWDGISWFYGTSDAYHADWIPYAYCKVQSIESHGFFQATIKRNVKVSSNGPVVKYRAGPLQKEAMKNAWDSKLGPAVAPSIVEIECNCIGTSLICHYAHDGDDCNTTYAWPGSQTLSAAVPGWYSLTVEAYKNGTMDSNTQSFYLDPSGCTGNHPLKTKPQVEGMTLYPQPAQDRLNVDMPEAKETHFILSDLHGKTIREWSSSANAQELDLSAIPNGTYLLQADTEAEHRFTEKVVILK